MIEPGEVPLAVWRAILREAPRVTLAPVARTVVEGCYAAVAAMIATGRPIYAVNTGFGKLAAVRIDAKNLSDLQRNLILSGNSQGGGEFDWRQVSWKCGKGRDFSGRGVGRYESTYG